MKRSILDPILKLVSITLLLMMITYMLLPYPAQEYIQVILEQPPEDESLQYPTYDEMKILLQLDPTDKKEYVKYYHNCILFARTLSDNIVEKGYHCNFVVVKMENSTTNHAIVSFDTQDQGLIYIEPQTDLEMDPSTFKVIYVKEL